MVSPRRSERVIKKSRKTKMKIIPGQTFSSNSVHSIKVEAAKPPKKDESIMPSKRVPKKKFVKQMPLSGIRPTIEECRYATTSLSELHPDVVDKNDTSRKTMLEACGMRDSITDSVISTMLSQNTTDANSKAAWSKLKTAFPDSWDDVAECDDLTIIEDTIRVAGLAKTRAERIQSILRTVKKERGEASLDYIRDFNDEEVKKELSRFKGLGPKTISCVLLFALGRNEFPVDTHVLRITQKMGWVSSGSSREGAYEYLNEMIPDDVKMDLHCLLVRHGKVCHRCAANGRPQFPPENGSKLVCPLVSVSSWAGSVPLDISKSFTEKDTEKKPARKKIKKECVPDKVKSEAL